MISHVVIFTPKSDLTLADRDALVAAFERALREIPDIRAVRGGRRLADEAEYFVAIDFDDRVALDRYLQHPAHQALATWFWRSLIVTFSGDFDVAAVSASNLRGLFGLAS